MSSLGRPTKLTTDTAEIVKRYVRVGLPLDDAAEAAGVSPRSLYRWLERGNPDRHAKRDAPHRAFRAAVEQARAEAELDLVVTMHRAARRGSWRAAAWLLERQAPEMWGPPETRPRRADVWAPVGSCRV